MADPVSKNSGTDFHCRRQRAAYLDTAKGLLIILVVVGHVWQAVYHNGILRDEVVYHMVDNWIYSFHMPAFFLLSGLFAMRSAQRPIGEFIRRKLRTIAYPYLLWSFLQSSLQLLMKESTTNSLTITDILRIPIYPQMQFWFLYALFFIFLFFILLKQLTSSRLVFLGVGILLFVEFQLGYGAGWVPFMYLSRYFIFFGIGIFCSEFLLLHRAEKLPGRVPLFFSALLLLVVSLVTPYPPDISHTLVRAWEGPLVALPGIFFILSVALLLFSVSNAVSNVLVFLGNRSLEIFVAHTIFAAGFRIILLRIAEVDSATVHILGGTAAGLGGPLILVYLAQLFGFRYLFIWPSGIKTKKAGNGVSNNPTTGPCNS